MNQIYKMALRVVNAFNKTNKEIVKIEDVQLVQHQEYTYFTIGSSSKLRAAYRYIQQRDSLKRLVKLPKGFPGSLGMILLVMFLGGCQSTYLKTKPDESNFDRFTHKQHMELGMTQKEVMRKFGSPQTVNKIWHKGQWAVQFVYYRSIYCEGIYCFVEFSEENNEVIDWNLFRMEYSGLVRVD